MEKANRLASWIGVCPGQNESAGVSRSGRTRPGSSNLKRLLGIAAMVAIRNKNSCLATAIWHVLHDKTHYQALGADRLTRRDPERAMRRMLKEANNLC
ncbi:transposase [Streptomyces sp. BH097]|uniref:transposase n=1 Tax=unclassified Streptomyces TaxID=2593676 RepID=UPI003BB7F2F3